MKAIITGVTGQSGSYLCDLLLEKGYEVHGLVRRSSSFNTERIEQHYDNPKLIRHYADVTDAPAMFGLIKKINPDEVYNLAAQSHVRLSFDQPTYSSDVNYLGCLNLLEAIRHINPAIKFYQASSSELFGNEPIPQNEDTKIDPISPYGIAKAAAYHLTRMYRNAYNIYAVNGILFNHESPRRAESFVSRKICKAAARIKLGLQNHLYLGNLNAYRDWGYAKDYMEAVYKMMQLPCPEDIVIGTGESHEVWEFSSMAFSYLGLDQDKYIIYNLPEFIRPIEVNSLKADFSKARVLLDWKPKTSFVELVQLMVDAELEAAAKEVRLKAL